MAQLNNFFKGLCFAIVVAIRAPCAASDSGPHQFELTPMMVYQRATSWTFINEMALLHQYDESIIQNSRDFVRLSLDSRLPTPIRTYIGIVVLDAPTVTPEQRLCICGAIFNEEIERSLVPALILLKAFYRSVPDEITDDILFEKMTGSGWRISRAFFNSGIQATQRIGEWKSIYANRRSAGLP